MPEVVVTMTQEEFTARWHNLLCWRCKGHFANLEEVETAVFDAKVHYQHPDMHRCVWVLIFEVGRLRSLLRDHELGHLL